jgi:hypothetical protein
VPFLMLSISFMELSGASGVCWREQGLLLALSWGEVPEVNVTCRCLGQAWKGYTP